MNKFEYPQQKSLRIEQTDPPIPEISASILYINRSLPNHPDKTPLHAHGFWQMEFLQAGTIRARLGSRMHTLGSGSVLVIPPGVEHRLVYEENNCDYISVKFEADTQFPPDLPPLLADTPEVRALRECFLKLIPEQLPASGIHFSWLGHLISSLLQAWLHPKKINETTIGPQTLAHQVRDFVVRRDGRSAPISELAKELDYSPSHLSTLFKKKTGKVLKSFIDAERSHFIAERLRFSDQTISDIAKGLEFPDVLSFSHFCRKNLGKGPREFRRENQEKTS